MQNYKITAYNIHTNILIKLNLKYATLMKSRLNFSFLVDILEYLKSIYIQNFNQNLGFFLLSIKNIMQKSIFYIFWFTTNLYLGEFQFQIISKTSKIESSFAIDPVEKN